jgi:RHS repeat-associated protein
MIRLGDPLPHDDGPYEYRGRFDVDAELHFAPARWYYPTLGVWLNDDAVGLAESVNVCCYVGNPKSRQARVSRTLWDHEGISRARADLPGLRGPISEHPRAIAGCRPHCRGDNLRTRWLFFPIDTVGLCADCLTTYCESRKLGVDAASEMTTEMSSASGKLSEPPASSSRPLGPTL